MATSKTTQTKKNSTVRHTRAIQYDRTKRPNSMPLAPQVSEELTQIVHPQTLAQVAHFHRLGLRERVLTLPVMVALVLTMIWRQIGSVTTLVRMLRDEGFLWSSPLQVSEQALSQPHRLAEPLTAFELLGDRAHHRHRPCSTSCPREL